MTTTASTRIDIRQASDAVFRRLTMGQASLILVRSGEKTVTLADGVQLRAGVGEAIALSAGEVVDVRNDPGADAVYRAATMFCRRPPSRHRGRSDRGDWWSRRP